MNWDLDAVYGNRFRQTEERRHKVWKILTRHFFQRRVKATDAVLDLGAGYCEFINHIAASSKYALDLNPVTPSKAAPDVTVFTHDAATSWPLPSDSLNVVFTSNFFEHLPNKETLRLCLNEVRRVLRPNGTFIALGPNIRFCNDVYWDFIDHHLPLSDRSLVEALNLAGLQIDKVIPRFLPYTMHGREAGLHWFVWLYLKMCFLWPVFGKQFLIIATKPCLTR